MKEKEQPLNEKLEPATKQQFDLLQKQIDTDPETKYMLTTIMGEIPQYYWLYSDVTHWAAMHSLFDLLKYFIFEGRGILLFSKTNNNFFTGFILYIDNGHEITHVKTASFYDDRKKTNPQLAYDLIINFLNRELSHRSKISWQAEKFNKYANNQYTKLLNTRGYIWDRTEDKKNKLWTYSVTGKK